MNLPDAHTHSSTAASGTAPRFICGTSPADWKQVALLAERDEHVTPFFGIHPWFLNPAEWKEEMPRLESLLQKIPHAGVGETGLDKCRRGIPGLPLQKEALERHLINRILEKEYPDAFRETLVVLDATTGQNALAQAREFADVADITGIILTKMDGTAKGGIAVAIHSELGIPVKYIGVGETIEDLQKFDSNQFVNALFDVQEDKSSPRP